MAATIELIVAAFVFIKIAVLIALSSKPAT